MKLYLTPGVCSLSPHIVLEELGIAHETESVNLKTKVTASGGNFLDINPKGYVPALQLGSGEVLTGPLAYAWYVEDVQSALGAVNDHHIADSLLRSVGTGAPEVDEAALVEAGIAACERLAAIEPFWR